VALQQFIIDPTDRALIETAFGPLFAYVDEAPRSLGRAFDEQFPGDSPRSVRFEQHVLLLALRDEWSADEVARVLADGGTESKMVALAFRTADDKWANALRTLLKGIRGAG
jgi:hypothetical protein